jgi:hypothetical protein
MTRRVAVAGLVLALAAVPAGANGATKPKKIDGTAVISFKGVGPITLGMTIAQARKAAGHGIVGGSEVTPGCRQDTVLPKRFGLTTLRMKGKIRVLYVSRTAMPTAKGIRVYDTLARLQAKYGSKLSERPSDVSSTDRVFVVTSGSREMKFTVSGDTGRISEIATGLKPEVDFSEHCS